MITNNDIAKLASILATKDDIFELHERMDSLDESVRLLSTATDNLARVVMNIKGEYTVMAHIAERHDRWIHQLAEKTKTSLKE